MSTLVVVVRDSVLGLDDGHRGCHLLALSSNEEELRAVVVGENTKANPPPDLERAKCASRNGNAMVVQRY